MAWHLVKPTKKCYLCYDAKPNVSDENGKSIGTEPK
jgi:hypothetical protein